MHRTSTTRPRRALAAVSALAVLALAACSSGDGSGDDADQGDPSASGTEGAEAFPVTIPTAFGDVEIPEEPTRVVALGWGDAETALALGVQPVGASDWLAFGGDGVGPWLADAYTESPEIIGTLEPSYEQIAVLDPDVILDTKSSGDPERYERLSEIAPTIGIPEGGEAYLTPMEDQVGMIAAALGRSDAGEQLLAEVDDAFAAARDEHPEFDGKTAVIGSYWAEGFGAYVSTSARGEFIQGLGFSTKPEIDEAAGEEFSANLGTENVDLLDADLTVIQPIGFTAADVEALPIFQTVPSVADGRYVVFDDEDLSSAFSLGTPTAVIYAIDNVVPLFAEALAGK
ncbi:iron-siderophore ABC transporter substrate-binding protein [Cellulosimicrobium protaetiae]|uniref:Iron-siderophore ABC transporter substrate-binding protein n=1 Tax=Cellulosimicrobium protaetiae TaxID=2587808 RepID=A0A6M5UC29_9MICO|nr:iron-siderophore ABC transporter substrate-binding protein [Cellulosimicrobium protaetiae]QJW35644.1 iron-siderophore ABC transporter substrate-binding protein [Cellulosimicrobium protaetiae]